MKGYKAFNKDLTCRGYQYEIGKTYEMDDKPIICERGFHFCENIADIFNYYNLNEKDTRVCEIEAMGEIVSSEEDSKKATNKIKILREISWEELKERYKDKNAGGWFNTGNRNTGLFNTNEPNARLFNKMSDVKMSDIDTYRINDILSFIDKREIKLVYKYEDEMTDQEKIDYPEYKTTGGALIKEQVKVDVQAEWKKVYKEDKNFIMSLPNFDADIFYECTGIRVKKSKSSKNYNT